MDTHGHVWIVQVQEDFEVFQIRGEAVTQSLKICFHASPASKEGAAPGEWRKPFEKLNRPPREECVNYIFANSSADPLDVNAYIALASDRKQSKIARVRNIKAHRALREFGLAP